jgi:hypothetical protein
MINLFLIDANNNDELTDWMKWNESLSENKLI